jgi:hypothetical protein
VAQLQYLIAVEGYIQIIMTPEHATNSKVPETAGDLVVITNPTSHNDTTGVLFLRLNAVSVSSEGKE